jgi:hypothetical protein
MMRARRASMVVAVALLLVGAGAAPAPTQTLYASETTDRYFRVEFDVTRNRKGNPAVEGYLYNDAHQTAQRVRLQVQRVDASGGVVGTSAFWVIGDVPMGSRAYFSTSVAEAASYRIQVLSFDWSCSGGSGGGGGGM